MNYWENSAELQSALQTKDEQMLKLTQTMSSMLKRVESLENQIVGLETQTPPHPKPPSSVGLAREAWHLSFSAPWYVDDGPKIQQ